MIKFLKISTIIILVLLFVTALILISFQSIVSIIAVPISILFMYYLIVLSFASVLNKKNSNQVLLILIWILFLTPLLWCLINPESLFNILTPKINLDMK